MKNLTREQHAKKPKKNTSHMTANLLLVFLNNCIITHIVCFFLFPRDFQSTTDSRVAARVQRWRSIPNQKDIISQDHSVHKERGHLSLNVIGCQLTRWFHSRHQGQPCLGHHTSAFKSPPGPISSHWLHSKQVLHMVFASSGGGQRAHLTRVRTSSKRDRNVFCIYF